MSMSELEQRCVDALDGCEAHIEDDSEAIAIVRAVLAEAGVAELVEALRLVADDYQTSEAHHPNHVLIPVATLGAARLAITKIGANQ